MRLYYGINDKMSKTIICIIRIIFQAFEKVLKQFYNIELQY